MMAVPYQEGRNPNQDQVGIFSPTQKVPIALIERLKEDFVYSIFSGRS